MVKISIIRFLNKKICWNRFLYRILSIKYLIVIIGSRCYLGIMCEYCKYMLKVFKLSKFGKGCVELVLWILIINVKILVCLGDRFVGNR